MASLYAWLDSASGMHTRNTGFGEHRTAITVVDWSMSRQQGAIVLVVLPFRVMTSKGKMLAPKWPAMSIYPLNGMMDIVAWQSRWCADPPPTSSKHKLRSPILVSVWAAAVVVEDTMRKQCESVQLIWYYWPVCACARGPVVASILWLQDSGCVQTFPEQPLCLNVSPVYVWSGLVVVHDHRSMCPQELRPQDDS